MSQVEQFGRIADALEAAACGDGVSAEMILLDGDEQALYDAAQLLRSHPGPLSEEPPTAEEAVC